MCSQMQVVVLALSLLLVSKVKTAPRTELLAHLLQNEDNRKEDLSRTPLRNLLSKLKIPNGNGTLSDDGMVLNRILRHLPFTPRERKTGCRNFFWKTFTSC